ncbi:phage tail protein [Desulfatitalea alkaliphila]|uniref:Phage tail protein n=1 Tax=Desulfatitalea alkaliphila TaxID=2929485 RepID=A0AA41UK73_9BACT|nr:phage tail protein [Desulfatitalea alkaliphila]MCJ8500101.1 phage tail protein [Desulfatitalea alkaliphila]
MIDANRHQCRTLAGAGQFDLRGLTDRVTWDKRCRVLRMRSTRKLTALPQDRARARTHADQPPATMDAYGTWAHVDATQRVILGGGVFPDAVAIFTLPADQKVADMCMHPQGMLYAIGKNSLDVATLYLINMRGAREDGKTAYREDATTAQATRVAEAPFAPDGPQPDRVVAMGDGALLLDRERQVFLQVVDRPLREQPTAKYPPATPRPCADGPRPQTLIPRPDLVLPAGYTAVDMAANPQGEAAVLLYPPEADKPAAVVLMLEGRISAPVFLHEAPAPFSIGWVRENEWALLFDGLKEALVYAIPFPAPTETTSATVSGRRYPLNRGHGDPVANPRFCNGLSRPVHYPSTDSQGRFLLRPLHPLSFPSYPSRVTVPAADLIDSGAPNTVWHRLFLEARLPKGSGVIVHLAADEDREILENHPQWFAHHFGTVPPQPDVPRATWLDAASEVPFFQGLLPEKPKDGTSGVFGVLVQRAGRVHRSLKGRYLKVSLTLMGGGQTTPEIAALRVYLPRFSYLDRYLPELYRESDPRRDAVDEGAANGSDFLQRFLCLFEGLLTPIEDRVAAAYMLTNPRSAPAEALDWLGRWVSLDVEMDLPEARKRLFIRHATDLYRKRGTLKGLALALDLLSDRMVERGEIVLLEDFRLRRTFATILGRDFSVEEDPLLMTTIPNANAYVGDTMILGDAAQREFLALYGAEMPADTADAAAVERFYARLSNRLTVLVHRQSDPHTVGLIHRIVAREVPAHIAFRVVPAGRALLVGLHALLGEDTYLQKTPAGGTARVGHSRLGRNDFIDKLPALDHRLEP